MQYKSVPTDVRSCEESGFSSDPREQSKPESEPDRQILRESRNIEAPFDYERLRSTCGDQDSQLLRLLEMFGREAGSDVAALEIAFNAMDVDQITRLSHRLKGSAAFLGAECLQKQAAVMELCGLRADMRGAQNILAGLTREFYRCRDFIEGFRANLSRKPPLGRRNQSQ